MCVQSGYKTITPREVGSCIHALNRKAIRYRAVRVYFGCLALIAIREAAKRTRTRAGRKPCEVSRFRVGELCSLTGLSESTVLRELRALERAGLLSFSEGSITIRKEFTPDSRGITQALAGKRSCRRPVPVPRSVLRFLARSQRPALGKTVLAYVFRGLSIDRASGEVKGAGTVKASWIADVMQVSLRAAKAARKELIALGLISKDTQSFQRKLNRDGAYFRVSLSWKGEDQRGAASQPHFRNAGDAPAPGAAIAPRQTKMCPVFAPPRKEKKTPYGMKYQKARLSNASGVCLTQGKEITPMLRDVQIEDLMSFGRTEVLYRQAVAACWIRDSEAGFLNWVGAAVRAKTCKARDPVRVFLGIVKRGLWSHISDADEERARQAIRRYGLGAATPIPAPV